jgi:hypothetical protein
MKCVLCYLHAADSNVENKFIAKKKNSLAQVFIYEFLKMKNTLVIIHTHIHNVFLCWLLYQLWETISLFCALTCVAFE